MGNTINKQKIMDFAFSRGIDLIGFANIERFANAPAEMHPVSIFPETKTLIVLGKRIIRGGWRGIEEGTYWPNYTYFNYAGLLNTYFLQLPLYETSCFIEDSGYEAVPLYSGITVPPPPDRKPLREKSPPPEVNLAIRIAATAAGLGEIGWSKIFLTKKFGPRQRLAAIATDMELEPDPLMEPNSICKLDMACTKGCPGAIPHIKENKTVEIRIEDKTYRWADVDMGKCTLVYHGADPRLSPFIPKAMPGYSFDVESQEVSEETAYKFCWPLSTGTWRKSAEHPSGYIIPGHAYIMHWGQGGLGVEGSRGCMRSCFDYLERQGTIEQTFRGGPFIKRPRWMLDKKGNPKN